MSENFAKVEQLSRTYVVVSFSEAGRLWSFDFMPNELMTAQALLSALASKPGVTGAQLELQNEKGGWVMLTGEGMRAAREAMRSGPFG